MIKLPAKVPISSWNSSRSRLNNHLKMFITFSTVCTELDIIVTLTSQNGSVGVAMGLTVLIRDALPPGITVTVERFGEYQL